MPRPRSFGCDNLISPSEETETVWYDQSEIQDELLGTESKLWARQGALHSGIPPFGTMSIRNFRQLLMLPHESSIPSFLLIAQIADLQLFLRPLEPVVRDRVTFRTPLKRLRFLQMLCTIINRIWKSPPQADFANVISQRELLSKETLARVVSALLI
jgi:hypothetical protein